MLRTSLISSRADRVLGMAAAAVAATSCAGLVNDTSVAQGDVVYSGPVNINIPSTTAGVYMNVVTGVFGTAALTPGWDINPWSATALNFFSNAASAGGLGGGGPMVGTGTTYSNLVVGTPVNASSGYVTNVGTNTINPATPLNFSSDNNYFGFRFVNEANGNAVHHGWLRVSLGGTAGAQPRAIVEYAYENVAGAEILVGAGAIPEPTSFTALALGAVGLIGRRRRSA